MFSGGFRDTAIPDLRSGRCGSNLAYSINPPRYNGISGQLRRQLGACFGVPARVQAYDLQSISIIIPSFSFRVGQAF